MNGQSAAEQAVRGPAIGLIVTGILSGFVALAWAASVIAGLVFGMNRWSYYERHLPDGSMVKVTLDFTLSGVSLLVGLFILYAGVQMSRLRSRELCLVASVLAMIPCISPCCLVGLPMGVWALVTLNRPEVRAAFR